MTPRANDPGCPACAQLAARRRARLTVGCPFEECPRCHSLAQKPSTNEWTLLGPGERAYWLADRVAPFLVLGLAPALVYWAIAFRDGDGDRRTLIALLAAGPLLIASLPLTSALAAIRRSRARMADPMYRARLIAFSRGMAASERT